MKFDPTFEQGADIDQRVPTSANFFSVYLYTLLRPIRK